MQKFVLGFAVSLSFAAAVAACGGSTSAAITADAAATDAGAAADVASATDATLSPDTTTAIDAGQASQPTPNHVSCGAGVCNTPAELCCTARDQTQTCTAATTPCTGGVPQTCDDKADCTNGDVCCIGAGPGGGSTPSPVIGCKAACGTIQGFALPQLCKTDAECTGVPCLTETCSGRTIQVCGGIPAIAKSFICP